MMDYKIDQLLAKLNCQATELEELRAKVDAQSAEFSMHMQNIEGGTEGIYTELQAMDDKLGNLMVSSRDASAGLCTLKQDVRKFGDATPPYCDAYTLL